MKSKRNVRQTALSPLSLILFFLIVFPGQTAASGTAEFQTREIRPYAGDSTEVPQLKIKRNFFGARFSFDTIQDKRINSLKDGGEFMTVMRMHPRAYHEMKQSNKFQLLALPGFIAMTAFAARDFAGVLKDMRELDNGKIPDTSFKVGDFMMTLIAGGYTIVMSAKARNHFNEAVHTFNREQEHNPKYLTARQPRIQTSFTVGVDSQKLVIGPDSRTITQTGPSFDFRITF